MIACLLSDILLDLQAVFLLLRQDRLLLIPFSHAWSVGQPLAIRLDFLLAGAHVLAPCEAASPVRHHRQAFLSIRALSQDTRANS